MILFLEKCPPIKSDSLVLSCTYNGQEVNCSDLAINGTILVPRCKKTHSLQNGLFESPMESVCLPDGKWSHQLYSCVLSYFIILKYYEIKIYKYRFLSKLLIYIFEIHLVKWGN